MTPKEKARSLYDTFYGELYLLHSMRPRIAKQCALIAVREVINACPVINLIDSSNNYVYSWEYWQQVEKEIKLL